METNVYLLLGGNLGDRLENLEKARNEINKEVGSITTSSQVYETAAWGITDQPAFLNQVLQLSTMLPPYELLHEINLIEDRLGRERHERWQARIIDIDILYYGNKVIEGQRLTLPHPHLHKRKFALAPLAELAPDFEHPILEKNSRELYDLCDDELMVSVLDLQAKGEKL